MPVQTETTPAAPRSPARPAAKIISVHRFDRRDPWMAFDISNGRLDARYLGRIPGVFQITDGAPIFAD